MDLPQRNVRCRCVRVSVADIQWHTSGRVLRVKEMTTYSTVTRSTWRYPSRSDFRTGTRRCWTRPSSSGSSSTTKYVVFLNGILLNHTAVNLGQSGWAYSSQVQWDWQHIMDDDDDDDVLLMLLTTGRTERRRGKQHAVSDWDAVLRGWLLAKHPRGEHQRTGTRGRGQAETWGGWGGDFRCWCRGTGYGEGRLRRGLLSTRYTASVYSPLHCCQIAECFSHLHKLVGRFA